LAALALAPVVAAGAVTVGGYELLPLSLWEELRSTSAAPLTVSSSATLPDLLDGTVAALFMPRYLNAAELRQAKARGVTLHPFTFAYDALAVTVSDRDPRRQITRAEARRLAADGAVEFTRLSLFRADPRGRKIIPVDGLLPTLPAIEGRSYPFIQGLYLYTNGLPTGETLAVIHYLTGAGARKSILRHGLIPGH
jgi:ABC-type phosphate transport system substrate-binding protein